MAASRARTTRNGATAEPPPGEAKVEPKTLQERMDEALAQYNLLTENMGRLQQSFAEMETQRQQLAGQMNLLRDLMVGEKVEG